MTPETLHKMLGFGHSDKKEIDGHRYMHHRPYLGVLQQRFLQVFGFCFGCIRNDYHMFLQTNWEVRKWVRCWLSQS